MSNVASGPALPFQADSKLNTCVVSHRRLYNEGCVQLFTWLSTGTTPTTSRTPVWTYETRENGDKPALSFPRSLDTLELSDVRMGDLGFQAAVSWLLTFREPMSPLTKLNLRANEIRGNAELARSFVSGCPRLESLVLSNNPLAPDFRQTLLSLLPKLPCLSKLHLSMTSLNLANGRALAAYISSGCKLVELYASSNYLGYKGVRAIVRALQNCWTMEKLDAYGNVDGTEEDDQNDSQSEREWDVGWAVLQSRITNLLSRNVIRKRQTAQEALTLLKYSRLMLQPLPSPKTDSPCHDCDCISPVPQATTPSPSQALFHALPVEVQLSILSHLAPTLSTQQRLRVFSFATDFSTLPSLRLCLPASKNSEIQCLPDPSNLAFPSGTTGKKFGSLRRDTTTTSVHTYGDGNCMGNKSVLCKRETDRQKWLAKMGCDCYDPELTT